MRLLLEIHRLILGVALNIRLEECASLNFCSTRVALNVEVLLLFDLFVCGVGVSMLSKHARIGILLKPTKRITRRTRAKTSGFDNIVEAQRTAG